MIHKIGQHTYTTAELHKAIEYMRNDIAYLESQLPKYQNNSYVYEKVVENIEHSKGLLNELLGEL